MSRIDEEQYRNTISAMGSVFGTNSGMNNIQSVVPYELPNITQDNGRALKRNIQNAINENKFQESVQLVENERGITIRILDDILFPPGIADLNTGSMVILNELGKILRDVPNDIRVEGHTDNLPIKNEIFASNWHLSVARATNTAYYLMGLQDLPPDKLSVVGYAEYQPVASNETSDGRRLNRRVDIVILNK